MRENDLIKYCTKQNFEGFGFQQLVTLCAHGALKNVASFSLAANSNSNFNLAGNLMVSDSDQVLYGPSYGFQAEPGYKTNGLPPRAHKDTF